MNRVRIARTPRYLAVTAACLAAVVVTTACNTKTTVTNKPAAAAPGTSAPAATSAPEGTQASASSTPHTTAKVGDTINLSGVGSGEKLAVTVVKVVDPAPPANEYETAGPGKRFVSVQVKLSNIGTAAYSDAVQNCVKVLDSQGQSFEASPFDSSAGPGFAGGMVTLAPGDSGLGYVSFEVPTASTPAKFQVALSSGMAPQTGAWLLN